jgi:Flp pilus assembly pilin Flp
MSQRFAFVRDQAGAVGTEMAIVVAIVVAIALSVGAVMLNSAGSFEDCIPTGPGDEACDFSEDDS